MARWLVIADAGVHSGFGTVTTNICERLATKYGHDIHVVAQNWQGDSVPGPLRLYLPHQKEPRDFRGRSRYVELLGKVMPDVILFIDDPAVVLGSLFRNRWDEGRILLNGFAVGGTLYQPPILAYLPIDGYESPGSWDKLLPRVTRIAMSHHGQKTMAEAPVVWHGVDNDVFKPRDKRDAKKALGFDPDKFLVLRVDKNSIRKDYPATWRALRPLLRKYPDMIAHFHCQPETPDGYNLYGVTWNDDDIRDRVSFSPNLGGYAGWGLEQLATLYAAADLFVSTSWGEGFGLTILEALASGTPVIASDHSAVSEVVGPGGVLVQPTGRMTMPEGQEQCLPDVDGFTREIEHLYLAGGVRRKLGKAAVEQAAKFSWDIAADRFHEIATREIEKGVFFALPDSGGPASSDQEQVRLEV